MIQAGHVLVSRQGAIVEADAGFGGLLQAKPESLHGRQVLDITAPADRSECSAAIEGLRTTGRPFSIVKRLLRSDGSLIWVRNSVSIMSGPMSGLIVATCAAVHARSSSSTPAHLLRSAKVLADLTRKRASVCDPKLLTSTAWEPVLEAYIAEAEGRTINVALLSSIIGHGEAVTTRWVAALISHDILEVEVRNPLPDAEKTYRLTGPATRRLETYLTLFERHLSPSPRFDHLMVPSLDII